QVSGWLPPEASRGASLYSPSTNPVTRVVVICTAFSTSRVKDREPSTSLLSVTCICKAISPATGNEPLRTPVCECRFTPSGNTSAHQTSAPVPPVAASCWEKTPPAVVEGKEEVATVGVAFTVQLRDCVSSSSFLSVTLTMK